MTPNLDRYTATPPCFQTATIRRLILIETVLSGLTPRPTRSLDTCGRRSGMGQRPICVAQLMQGHAEDAVGGRLEAFFFGNGRLTHSNQHRGQVVR